MLKLLDFYQVADPERGQLLALAHDARQKGWWEDYADVIPDEYLTLIGLEAEASSLAQWQVEVVPGLLQTEEYARQILLAYQQVVPNPPSVIDKRVRVRMIRQEVLTRDPPLELSVVLDESVLLRRVGSHSVMRAQLLQLVEASGLPNVTLRIRLLSGQRSLAAASFGIFSFGPSGDAREAMLHDVAFTEYLRSEFYVESDLDTYNHRLVFQQLADQSLTASESRELVLETARRVWA